GEYISIRATLRDLVQNQAELARQLKLKPGESVFKTVAGPMIGNLAWMKPGASPGRDETSKPLPDDVDVKVARTTPAEMSRLPREVNEAFRALLRLDGVPCAERIAKIAALKTPGRDDPLSRLVEAMLVSSTPFVRAVARGTATLHATECLVALR